MGMVRVPAGWIAADLDLAALGWDNLLADPRALAAYHVEGRLLLVNDVMLDMVRWPIEELDRRGWIACLYPEVEEQARTLANFRALCRPGAAPRRHTRQARRGDGSHILFDLLSAPLSLPDGGRAILTTALDATERATPLGVGRGYRELVEDAPDVLFRADARSGEFLFVSRAVERVLGFSAEEIYRQPRLPRDRLLPEHREAMRAAIKEVMRGERQWLILEYRRKDDSLAMLHQALYPIRDASGQVVVIEGVARDITAVRSLERQLSQTVEELRARNAELSSLDRLKSQLLANVSHELRTPLVTIKGYNELMLRGSLGPVSERQQRALEVAGHSTDRLVDLIETLLDFARREEGRLEVRRTRMDARLAFRDAAQHLAPRIAEKGLLLSVDLPAQPLEVEADRARLAQVVKALLSNAEKFCEAPGSVRLSAEVKDGWVVLRVSDTGIGIPEGERDRIFERFYQVDASTTRRFGGAGLGLSLAREILQLHGGTISVESQEGRGSTFAVRLPLAPALAAGAQGERPVVLLGAPAARLAALHARLEAESLTILEAASRVEVIRRARRHRPDAVVLALEEQLVETIQTLHQDADTMDIPVIAMVSRKRRDQLLPIADYVVGLDEAPRLAGAVRRLLGHERTGAPRGQRVLVVDDEPEIVDFTRFVLEREGYTVEVAASADAALAAARLRHSGAPQVRGERVDLVILDIALEGLDGIELCRRIKTEPATAHLPVLMVTAMTGDEVRHAAFEAGADGLITKPFGVEEFLRQVRLHLPNEPESTRAE